VNTCTTIGTEFNSTGLSDLDSLSDSIGNSTGFRVRHKTAGTQLTTERTNHFHRIGSGNQNVKIGETVFDLLNQILVTDDIGTCLLGLGSSRTVGNNRDSDRFTGSAGQRNRAADRLI
jgi:hypothetical protein